MKPENEYNERQEQQKTPETQERMSLKNKKIKHGHAGNTGAENNELFASMPVAQAILMLAVPTVVSQIITIIYNMADTFFIGQLGDPKQVARSYAGNAAVYVYDGAFQSVWSRRCQSDLPFSGGKGAGSGKALQCFLYLVGGSSVVSLRSSCTGWQTGADAASWGQ